MFLVFFACLFVFVFVCLCVYLFLCLFAYDLGTQLGRAGGGVLNCSLSENVRSCVRACV